MPTSNVNPPTYEEDPNYWLEQARNQPGMPGWASRFSDNIAQGYAQQLAATAVRQAPPSGPVSEPPTRTGAEGRVLAEEAAAAQTTNRKKKKGHAANVLTGPEGAGLPQSAAATLLGE